MTDISHIALQCDHFPFYCQSLFERSCKLLADADHCASSPDAVVAKH